MVQATAAKPERSVLHRRVTRQSRRLDPSLAILETYKEDPESLLRKRAKLKELRPAVPVTPFLQDIMDNLTMSPDDTEETEDNGRPFVDTTKPPTTASAPPTLGDHRENMEPPSSKLAALVSKNTPSGQPSGASLSIEEGPGRPEQETSMEYLSSDSAILAIIDSSLHEEELVKMEKTKSRTSTRHKTSVESDHSSSGATLSVQEASTLLLPSLIASSEEITHITQWSSDRPVFHINSSWSTSRNLSSISQISPKTIQEIQSLAHAISPSTVPAYEERPPARGIPGAQADGRHMSDESAASLEQCESAEISPVREIEPSTTVRSSFSDWDSEDEHELHTEDGMEDAEDAEVKRHDDAEYEDVTISISEIEAMADDGSEGLCKVAIL